MVVFELLLWLVPVAAVLASRRYACASVWRNTGIALGLVVSPGSLGLYALYFLGPVAAILGMLGLLLNMLHGAPGYALSVAMGLIPSHTPVEGSMHIPIEVLNALIWAVVYGALGRFIDALRARRRQSQRNAV